MRSLNSRTEKPKFDMFDFVDGGKAGRTLYDCLLLTGLGDWSTESLIYNALPIINLSNDSKNMKKFMLKEYGIVFDKLTENIDTLFSSEEREDIFGQLNSVNPNKYNIEAFSTCLDFLRENREKYILEDSASIEEKTESENSSTSEQETHETQEMHEIQESQEAQKTQEINEYNMINNIILGNIIIKMKSNVEYENDPDGVFKKTLAEIRNHIFKAIYFPKINNDVKRSAPDRANNYNADVEEILFALKILTDSKKMAEYDEYLEAYQKEADMARQKIALRSKCEAKRKSVVNEEIKKALPENIKEEIVEPFSIAKLFADPTGRAPRKDYYKWKLNMHKYPVLLLDGKTSYSNDGEENQRVIAVGYGSFTYEIPEFNYTSSILELVGVTKKGEEGAKNYFVIMPVENFKLKKDSEVSPQDNVIQVFDAAKIMEKENKTEWKFVQGDGIPKDLEEFYKNVIMSDEYLQGAERCNYRFTGFVTSKDGKPELRPNEDCVGISRDFEACKYAALYPGIIISDEEKTKESMNQFLGSAKFYINHLQLMEEIIRGKKNRVRVSNGAKKQEGDGR